jgi:SAM-dependent methyltransferase
MADQGSEGLLSPFLRKRRLAAAKPFIQGRVLDVGCGAGHLADFVSAELYVGVDVDEGSLQAARLRHPHHRFLSQLPPRGTSFNTVAALAVIEHLPAPSGFLKEMAARLSAESGSRIICTTPCPEAEVIHKAGSSIGLFSRHANEEHERLLGRSDLERLAKECGLGITFYRRFLIGMNQLCIMRSL